MADPEIKQEPTQATRTRSLVTAGNTAATPVVVAGVLGWLFEIIRSYSPTFPIPTESTLIYLGIAIAAGLSYWSSYSIRGTKTDETTNAGS